LSDTPKKRRRKRLTAIAMVLFLIFGGLGTWWGLRVSRVHWARNEALPRANLLAVSGDVNAALKLARQAERYLPNDPEIEKLRHLYGFPLQIQTSPPGAAVYLKEYMSPDAPWDLIGSSPIDGFPLNGFEKYRLRIVKRGFETVEVAVRAGFPAVWSRTLTPAGSAPAGMVYVGGERNSAGIAVPDYWIDKYEVTNRQYKEFVAAGGYHDPKFWKNPFVQDGRSLSFEQAMAEFTDSTGRPGPATWQFGSYGEGKADFPVSGVSWYEAAAYAEFAGKSLPTSYHWRHAAGEDPSFSYMAKLSNFDRKGPVKVGSYAGISPVGAFDMAGERPRVVLDGRWESPLHSRRRMERVRRYVHESRKPPALRSFGSKRFPMYPFDGGYSGIGARPAGASAFESRQCCACKRSDIPNLSGNVFLRSFPIASHGRAS
jgi:Uncharacterized conserved protein